MNNKSSASNIGENESRKRLYTGLIGLTAGVLFAVFFLLSDYNYWWRTGLFIPFWVGFLGLFEYWSSV